MKKAWVYDLAFLMESITTRVKNKPSAQRLVLEYLRNGAHPFYLMEAFKLCEGIFSPDAGVEENVMRTLRIHPKFKTVPEIGNLSDGPLSRLFDEEGRPRYGLDEGVLHGALVETYNESRQIHLLNFDIGRMQQDFEAVVPDFLQHPEATFGLMITASLLLSGLGMTMDAVGEKLVSDPAAAIQPFVLSRFVAQGIKASLEELLGLWERRNCEYFYLAFSNLMLAPIHTVCPPGELPFTRILQVGFDEMEKGSAMGKLFDAALVFFRYVSENDARNRHAKVLSSIIWFLDNLKAELPNVQTYHTIVRWIEVIPREVLMSIFFVHLAFRSGWRIDERAEFLVEELVGEEVWKILCGVASEHYWVSETTVSEGVKFRIVDKLNPQFALFKERLLVVLQRPHKWKEAWHLDVSIHDAGSTFREARETWEYNINLLASDICLAVTDLRSEWMPVARRKDEFVHDALPVIEVAQHPELGQNGAACTFRVPCPEVSDSYISGSLDCEGIMTLDNVHILTTLGKQSLQAAVSQTLAAVLIPAYVEKLPPRTTHGNHIPSNDDLWATRPVIHTLGDLMQQGSNGESAGTKINPIVAEMLFRWLLDEDPTRPFRLFREVREKLGVASDIYYGTWREAKNLLTEKRVTLSDAFFRVVRAHTRPVAVFLNRDGNIIVRKTSKRALRNYERYRNDVGRTLDFTPVRKTYALPEGRRISLDVGRTFVQGAFRNLAEMREALLDLALKQKVKETFLLE